MGNLRTFVWTLAAAVSVLGSAPALAQGSPQGPQGAITGRVTDDRGQPLSTVAVTVQGTQLGGVSGADGTYRVARVPAGAQTVTARRIGYSPATKPVTVTDGGTATVDFVLTTSATNLQQVVVTGTAGNQTRVAQGAVVSTINASEVTAKAPIANVTQVLQGRVPSLTIVNGSGTTGSASRINIRGAASISLSNEPLVFIDGIRMQSSQRTGLAGINSNGGVGGQSISALNDINPDDIESIEVVKGPAAATLYGADASAGVIQIITKHGRLGAKRYAQSLAVEYNNIQPNFTPKSNFGVCTAAQVLPTSTSALCQGQTAGTIVSDNPTVRGDAFRNGNLQSLRYSGQGGGDNYGYFISGDVDNELGTTRNNYLIRRDGRANLNWVASPKLSFNANLALSRNDIKLPQGDQSSFGYLVTGALAGPPNVAITKDANGNLSPGFGFGLSVPLIADILAENNTLRSTPSLTANWTPLGWLSNRLIVGGDLSTTDGTTLFPKNSSYCYTSGSDIVGCDLVRINRENINIYTVDYLGNIKTSFLGNDRITSDLSFGSQFINTSSGIVSANGTGGLLSNSSNLVSSEPTRTGGQSYSQSKQIGFLAQEQLSFGQTLFLEVGARVDKFSSFGTNASSFFLPKVSVSYVLSQEGFWDRFASIVPTLRLRAAYGTTGRAPPPGASLQTYVQNPYITDVGTIVNGATLANPGNADLKPEKGKEFEGGFDAGFLGDRLGLELTYYSKTSANLLLLNPIPPSLGYTSNPFSNIGKVLNRGFEFTVRGTPINRENFTWDATFIGSTLHNEVLSLGGLAPITISSINVNRRFIPGRSSGAWYVKRVHGYDPNTGIVTVSDTAEYAGNQLPTTQGSFNTTFTLFKKLRLYALFQGQTGAKTWNLTEEYQDQFIGNSAGKVIPAGQPGGYSAEDYHKRFGPFVTVSGKALSSAGAPVADAYLQSSNYVRLQELSATLSVPSSLARSLRASGASFTIGGRNLRLWKNKGNTQWDPDVAQTLGGADSRYTQFQTAELFTTPPVRRWFARLNLQF